MHAILSPAESLGLSGTVLDGRIRNACGNVGDFSLARIAARLRADALAHGIVYEREGLREPIRVMLRPLVAHRDQLTYVHHTCIQLVEALRRFPGLFLEDPDIRRILAVTPGEERWLADIWTADHGRHNSVYGRLDAVCHFAGAGWQDTLKFLEPNLSGVGGIHYSPIVEQLVMRDVVPALRAQDPGLVIEPPQDQRDLFTQLMIDHARALGRQSCQLCFIEPKYEHEGPDEQTSLEHYLSGRHGLVITHADPRELTVRDGEVYYEDIRVDVAYRDYEVRDLIALEQELGRPLEAMRLLFRQNRIVSSLAGDFDHKSGFEILTDPVLAERLFSPDDCRLFHRHVLWTRLMSERRTMLPNNIMGDLPDFVRRQREQLVLKPNRGYGGAGVTIGAATAAADWDALIETALSKSEDPGDSWIVQAAAEIPVAEFPVIGTDGRVYNEPFYCVMGFAPTDNGLGALCRVSQKQVVNVAQNGGLAALLLGEPPENLQIPRRPQRSPEGVQLALRRQIAELRHLDQAIALMEWDEETNLPVMGRLQRGEQVSTLEGLRHAILESDRLGDLIREASEQCRSDADLRREIFLLRRERERVAAVPEDLVRALANAKSQALAGWEEAREKDEFPIFALPFSQLLALVRERASYLAADGDIYDALLEEQEPEMTRARLDPLFAELRQRLVPLAHSASQAMAGEPNPFAGRNFPAAGQWQLSRRILSAAGFDFTRGRLDRSTHPFTMLAGEDDVRLTSRVDEGDLSGALFAGLHELGHALYDQGFKASDRDTLLADGASAAMHEGQARLWENHVGRSRAFMEFLLPHIREIFPGALDGVGTDQLWKGINRVRPDTNRVRADEMTYHLHIMLRYELETALLSGDLAVSELPRAWNDRSLALLGVRPGSDRDGVLQDVHWAVGMFGYFPTYTIGSLYAAQLTEAFCRESDFDRDLRQGRFGPLHAWLTKNIYELGNRFSAEEVMIKATGRGLDTAAFFSYIKAPQRAWN
jgi:carboxypeptidase Taq